MMTALIAAIPEPNAKPCLPCSKSAITLSNEARVGFAVRESHILVLNRRCHLVNTCLFDKSVLLLPCIIICSMSTMNHLRFIHCRYAPYN